MHFRAQIVLDRDVESYQKPDIVDYCIISTYFHLVRMSDSSHNLGFYGEESPNGESHLAAGPSELLRRDSNTNMNAISRIDGARVSSIFPAAEQVFSFRTGSPLSFSPLDPLLSSSTNGFVRKRSHDAIDDAEGSVRKQSRWMREETSLWTAVKQFLQDPSPTVEPAVSCPICYTVIAIQGLRSQHPDPIEIVNRTQRVGVTTICNHIICQDYFYKHIESRKERAQDPTCPVCRLKMMHSFDGCEHIIYPKRLPLFSKDTVDMIPLTLPERPEGARLVPQACLACLHSTARQYLDISLNYVANLVHGAANSHEDNLQDVPGWASVVSHINSVIGNFTDVAKACSWTRAAPSDVRLQIAFVDDSSVTHLDPSIRYSGQDSLVSLNEVGQNDMYSAQWLVPYCRPRKY